MRDMEDPMRAPAHTMGASGPTLNPKADVRSDMNKTGKRWMALEGRRSMGAEEKAWTKSATVNVAPNAEESNPRSKPPKVIMPVMKYDALRDPNFIRRKAGKSFHRMDRLIPSSLP
mmetsp:Transcript_342/g.678  ORF Transcript_342/g.678 Transcript_342/m.678 type:complete len:116 (+) Transcript_342:1037-1384(+)